MAEKFKIELIGFRELEDVYRQMQSEFYANKTENRLLTQAARASLRPALQKARALVPKDTMGLFRSLQIEARHPNRRDKKSKYVQGGDAVIGLITTAPGRKLKKLGIKSDARAVAQEFGTARVSAQPYMRRALESTAPQVLANFGNNLWKVLQKYKAKQAQGNVFRT